jgi:hypothetical protein
MTMTQEGLEGVGKYFGGVGCINANQHVPHGRAATPLTYFETPTWNGIFDPRAAEGRARDCLAD